MCQSRFAGSEPGWFYGIYAIAWLPYVPVTNTAGSWISLNLPAVNVVEGNEICTVDATRIDDGRMRIEVASPAVQNQRLTWNSCEPINLLMTSVPARSRADQALFRAGLLTGVITSLIVLAVETLIGLRRRW